jgi:hypothetical protein
MPVTVICKGCGNAFQAGNKRTKYCSGRCYRAKEQDHGQLVRQSWSAERKRAGAAVQTAIYQGRLVRQPCEICGKQRVDAHHDDYSRPLDVRWLCRSHHKQLHVALARLAS